MARSLGRWASVAIAAVLIAAGFVAAAPAKRDGAEMHGHSAEREAFGGVRPAGDLVRAPGHLVR